MKILTWNLEWARPGSQRERIIRDALVATSADLICLTEAYAATLPNGYILEAEVGDRVADRKGAKKVLLWSRDPWARVRPESAFSPPGRIVSGVTGTGRASIQVIGVCIPWFASNTPRYGGSRRPWDDHLEFIVSLGRRLNGDIETTVVLGDFNQRLPPRKQPKRVAEALEDALANFTIPTRNFVGSDGNPTIDHIAHTRDLRVTSLTELPSYDDGLRLSDHFGIVGSLSTA